MSYVQDLEKTSRILFPFYLLILAFSTIPFGSNRPWAWTVLAVAAFSLLYTYLMSYGRASLRPPILNKGSKTAILFCCLWLLYQALQLVPLPIEIVNFISSNTVLLKNEYMGGDSKQFVSLSFSYKDGLQGFLKSCLYVAMFILTILLVQSRDKMRYVLLTIAVVGVSQAIWGFTSAFLEQSAIRGISNADYTSQITGTFVNRNHFAGYINLSIAAIIGTLLCVGIREKRQIHREAHQHHWQSRLMDWRIHLVFYLGLLLCALFYSESRGAYVSFAAMCVVGALYYIHIKANLVKQIKSFKWIIVIVFIIAIVNGLDYASKSYSELNADSNGRIDIWMSSVNIVKDFWLTGTGSGSYQYLYPVYDSGKMPFSLEHAHNDYLEVFVEQGLIGFSLMATIIIISLKNAVRHIVRKRNIRNTSFAIAAILAATGMLVHSIFDFNFQIPSNILHFFVFLGLAALQGTHSLRPEKREVDWDEELFLKENQVKGSHY